MNFKDFSRQDLIKKSVLFNDLNRIQGLFKTTSKIQDVFKIVRTMGTETDFIHYFTTIPVIFARPLCTRFTAMRIDRITAESRSISGGKTVEFVFVSSTMSATLGWKFNTNLIVKGLKKMKRTTGRVPSQDSWPWNRAWGHGWNGIPNITAVNRV